MSGAMVDAVLVYPEHRVPIFPAWGVVGAACACGVRACKSEGKHPVGFLAPHGFQDATLDVEVIRAWWRRVPDANVATPTGGWCVVLDVDPRNGGDVTLAELERQYGPLPLTPEVLTGGGGRHLYFQPVPGLGPGSAGAGLDVKAAGGYVLLPPSRHKSGRDYVDEILAPLFEVPLAPMPAWLLDAIKQQSAPTTDDGWISVEKPPFTVPEKIRGGMRHETLFKLTRSLKAKNLSRDAVWSVVVIENATKCEPPLDGEELQAYFRRVWEQKDRPGFDPSANGGGHRETTGTAPGEAGGGTAAGEAEAEPFSEPLGVFLARDFPAPVPFIEGLLSDDGGGWLGGEEKTSKTWWALDEGLAIALGQPVAQLFKVPTRKPVLFIEEEDSPRRTHRRLRALLHGRGLDPDDPDVCRDLDGWFRIIAWKGFTLDVEAMVTRLAADLDMYRPAVCYLDVLRKVTLKDLNKAVEAGVLLATLDKLRRAYGVVFRVVHHYRKQQSGGRGGRGSQEIGGSYQLGAWGENSLFFEPIGRQQGPVRVSVQSKDLAPVPPFIVRLKTEGPAHAPVRVELVAEEERPGAATSAFDESVYQAVATLPVSVPVDGEPGVSIAALALYLSRSKDSVQRALDRLLDAGRVRRTGKLRRSAVLYGVTANDSQ